MKIQVESLGLPALSELIGKKAFIEFPGGTINDLVSYIVNKHGQRARRSLLDGEAELDMTIQVMINDDGFLRRDEFHNRNINDGDKVRFLLLVAGG